MISNVDGTFSIPAAKLRDVRDGSGIQTPQRVFIEGLDALLQSDLDAVQQQIVLSQQILLLHSGEQLW